MKVCSMQTVCGKWN